MVVETNLNNLYELRKLVKYKVLIAVVISSLFGALLVNFGIAVNHVYDGYKGFISDQFYNMSNRVIWCGYTQIMAGLVGGVGAIKNDENYLYIYSLFLFLMLIVEIAISSDILKLRADIDVFLKVKMEQSMDYFHSTTKNTWNVIQNKHHCCGVSAPEDWRNFSKVYNLIEIVRNVDNVYYVPSTCCTYEECNDEGSIYKSGCLDSVVDTVSECVLMLFTVCVCFAGIQFLGLIYTIYMARSMGNLNAQVIKMEIKKISDECFEFLNMKKFSNTSQSTNLSQLEKGKEYLSSNEGKKKKPERVYVHKM